MTKSSSEMPILPFLLAIMPLYRIIRSSIQETGPKCMHVVAIIVDTAMLTLVLPSQTNILNQYVPSRMGLDQQATNCT